MRQKKIKHLNIEHLKQLGVITSITPLDFQDNQRVVLEVGSGKGKFISQMALDDPLTLFIAFEINMSVLYRIYEKKRDLKLDNLMLVLGDANHLDSYFSPRTIDEIYLNFSDPWPKARHHKRRLTYPTFLNIYKKILKKDGKFEFRTDHHSFFEDSCQYFASVFNKIEINHQLAESKYMTEYEIQKRVLGPIMQIKGVNHEDSPSL